MTELQAWIIVVAIVWLAAFNTYQVYKSEIYNRKVAKRAMEIIEEQNKS